MRGMLGFGVWMLAALTVSGAEPEAPPERRLVWSNAAAGDEGLLAKLAERDDWDFIQVDANGLTARSIEALAQCATLRRFALMGGNGEMVDGVWRSVFDGDDFLPLAKLPALERVSLNCVSVGKTLEALAACPALRELYIEAPIAFDGADLAAIGRFPALESFILNGGSYGGAQIDISFQPADLKPMAGCRTLRHISLRTRHPLDARGVLDALAPLSGLESLSLSWRNFDAPLFARMAEQWPNMSAVALPDTTDATFATLAKFAKVRGVSLGDATDDAVRRLADFPALTNVSLSGDGLTDNGIAALAALPALREVSVHGEQLTDRSFIFLAELPELRHVFSIEGQFTDAGLAALAEAPSLRLVVMTRNMITADGEKAFKEKRPDVALNLFFVEKRAANAAPAVAPPAAPAETMMAPEDEYF